jgi:hypothetical protein
MRGTENDQLSEKGYKPFLTNRALSYHHDTVALANEMNMRSDLDNKLQYEFFLNTVRPKKRYAKWDKKEDHGDLAVVKEYFNYSDTKALQALTVLTNDQINEIRRIIDKGGRNA